MRLEEHKDLWKRIREFSIDDPDASKKFSDKLAFENNWSAGFTRRAIEEYKKFIFLCCISPNGASPSEIVDEVWHLHLTYTHNYWKEFCRQTLEKEIHHHPSKGGPGEKGKHQKWYEETILLYRDIFGESPPTDIWPPPLTSSHDPFYIPHLDYKQVYKKHLYIFALPLLYPLLFGKFHPFELTGPQFLGFYGSLVFSILYMLFRVYGEKKKLIEAVVDEYNFDDATSYQLARFVYGRNKAIQAAIVDLVSKGILLADSRGRLFIFPSRFDPERDLDNPLAGGIQQPYAESQRIQLTDLAHYFDDDRAYHDSLLKVHRIAGSTDIFNKLLFIAAGMMGLFRIAQGEVHHKPVGYLSFFVFITIVIAVVCSYAMSGKKIIQDIFEEHYASKQLPVISHQAVPMQFVFLGLTSLGSIAAFNHLDSVFRLSPLGSVSTDGSACGSSGCGSSCGGSGCGGGGGCGGCGGD